MTEGFFLNIALNPSVKIKDFATSLYKGGSVVLYEQKVLFLEINFQLIHGSPIGRAPAYAGERVPSPSAIAATSPKVRG